MNIVIPKMSQWSIGNCVFIYHLRLVKATHNISPGGVNVGNSVAGPARLLY